MKRKLPSLPENHPFGSLTTTLTNLAINLKINRDVSLYEKSSGFQAQGNISTSSQDIVFPDSQTYNFLLIRCQSDQHVFAATLGGCVGL